MSSTKSFKEVNVSGKEAGTKGGVGLSDRGGGYTPNAEERDPPITSEAHTGAALAGVSFLVHSTEDKLITSIQQEFANIARQNRAEAQRIQSLLEQQRRIMQQQHEVLDKQNRTIQTLQRQQGDLLQAFEGLKQQLKEYHQSKSSQQAQPALEPAMVELPIQRSPTEETSTHAKRTIPVYSRYGAPDPQVLPNFASVVSELKKRESKGVCVQEVSQE